MYVYEEQEGSVKLAGNLSGTFSIVNGTRQGSVLSPILFSLYLDGLLKEQRQEGVGCHVGGVWMGASGYADDLILLSPSRESMSKMIRICQEYGVKYNLIFSTDPNPTKSKTKCVYFCGLAGAVQYPAPLILDGKCLPWVLTATHLGHELHQAANMNHDVKVKRARFIGESTEIRESFSFADPLLILRAVRLYCGHYYGAMLWDFRSEMVLQFCRSWNTCVKLSYDIPRSTHTYLFEHCLASEFTPVKTEMMARYIKFHRSLKNSKSF